MKYYLLFNEATNRLVISNKAWHGWEIQKTTIARSWIDAKKRFGFELTALQEMIYAKDDCPKAGRGLIRHQQDAGKVVRPPDRDVQDGVEACTSPRFFV